MDALAKSNIRLSNEYHIASRSFAGGLMPHNLLAVEKNEAPRLKAEGCGTCALHDLEGLQPEMISYLID